MIRIATEKDIPAMLAIYGPYVEHTTYSFEYTVPEYPVFLQRFRDHVARFPWLVWEDGGRVLGYAYAGAPWERAAYGWNAEASVYLAPEIQGRGVGRALYQRLEELLKAQGYRKIYAIITEENTGSIAFHAACGYREEAKFTDCGYKMGRWLSVVWMAKEIAGPGFDGKSPKSWREIVENTEKTVEK